MKNFENVAAKAQSIGHQLNTMYATVTQWEGLEPTVQREHMKSIPAFKQLHYQMMLQVNAAFHSVVPEHGEEHPSTAQHLAYSPEYLAIQEYNRPGVYPNHSITYDGQQYAMIRFMTRSTPPPHRVLQMEQYRDIQPTYAIVALWLAQAKSLLPLRVELETLYHSIDVSDDIDWILLHDMFKVSILVALYDSMVDFNYDPDTIWVWQEQLLTADFLHRLAVQQHVFVDILEDFHGACDT